MNCAQALNYLENNCPASPERTAAVEAIQQRLAELEILVERETVGGTDDDLEPGVYAMAECVPGSRGYTRKAVHTESLGK